MGSFFTENILKCVFCGHIGIKANNNPGRVHDYIFIILLFTSPTSTPVVKEIKVRTFSWVLGTACWSWLGWGCCVTPRGDWRGRVRLGVGFSRKPEPPEGGEDWEAHALSFKPRPHYIKG